MEAKENYLDTIPSDIRHYFQILSPDFPTWLADYINTPEMLRLSHVSQLCGCQYLNIWNTPRPYSVLDHSIACALIVWHFTRSKTQSLAALFHDISTPAFKHCIDVMNGDAKTQESTEAPTYEIIKNSKSIRALLRRDKIRPKAVSNYHLYPIADNDSPRLSSDRLEYNFMNIYLVADYGITMPLSKIKRYYNNLTLGAAEDGETELAFIDYKIAAEFIGSAHNLWHNWCDNRWRLVAKFYADIVARAIRAGDFTAADLYHLSDDDVASKLKHSKDQSIRQDFKKFCSARRWHEADYPAPAGKYSVTAFPVKKRFLDPLVCTELNISLHTGKLKAAYARLSSVCPSAKECISEIKYLKSPKYAWFDFKKSYPT